MTLAVWAFVLYLVGALILGAVIGFFLSRRWFMKYLEKNPPVNEKMIRTMFLQMGRKPSEKDIKRVLNSMNAQK